MGLWFMGVMKKELCVLQDDNNNRDVLDMIPMKRYVCMAYEVSGVRYSRGSTVTVDGW